MAEDAGELLKEIERLLAEEPDKLTIRYVTELQETRVSLEERINKGYNWLQDYQGCTGKRPFVKGDMLLERDANFSSAYDLFTKLTNDYLPRCMVLLKQLTSMKLPFDE